MTTVDPGDERDRLPFGQHHAFVIGINAYAHVSPLKTAVEDARQVAEVLRTQQHFLVHPPLLDATGAAIRALLHTTLAEQVKPDDRVFFYFAGHGVAADGDDGPAGYIVPADADPADVATLVAMTDLQRALNALPCRHLLLVLDCCFSGAFKWSSRYRVVSAPMPKKIYQERFDRFIHDPAWQVITSAAYDQKALDVIDGKATGARGPAAAHDETPHSPFARALFDGLAGAADARDGAEGDGVITATELYSYIRDQVEPQTITAGERLRQTPGFFPLPKHDKGEFIFLHPRHRLNLPRLPDRNPYQGLAPFDQDDQVLFYGRERVTAELVAKAGSQRLLVITGASGTGKSSVARAGLLPKLKAQGFRILTPIRPGEHPLAELERAVAEASAADPSAPPAPASSAGKSVLLIDQFEEVITRCADAGERERFESAIHGLVTATTAPGLHRIVLTVRADFEPQFGGGALAAEWSTGRCTVPPFSLEELKEVIVLPTLQEVLIFDPAELVDQIVEDVVQAPGALPLLSYALSELYEAYRTSGRQDRALKKEDYDRGGGVMGALGKKADAVYRGLDASARDLVRKITLRMVSAEGDLASRRVPMRDLVYAETAQPLVDRVIETLVDARLIVRSEDSVEPAHDALVRQWTTLQEWIHAVGEDKLILGARLGVAADEFARSHDEGLLWNDRPDLPLLEAERHQPQRWFNAKEESFIDRSVARRRQVLEEREAQLRKIAEQQAARARLQRRAAWALSVAAAGLLALLAWVVVQTRALSVGNSGLLASAAEAAADAGLFDRSLRLAVMAARSPWPAWLHPVDATAAPVVARAADSSPLLALFRSDAPVVSVSFAPDGGQVIVAAGDAAHLMTVATGREMRAVKHDGGIEHATLSADGARILTEGAGTVRLWDAASGTPLGGAIAHDRDRVGWASLGTRGRRLLTASGASVRVWDATTGRQVTELRHDAPVESIGLSPDGARAVTAAGSTVTIWDAALGTRLRALAHDAPVSAVGFSADGAMVLTVSGGTARLWESATGRRLRVLNHRDDIDDASISPDGRRVVTVGGSASLWDAATGKRVSELRPNGGIWLSASFSADSRRLITRSNQSFLWNAADGRAISELTNDTEVSDDGQASDFSADGTRVVTAAGKAVRIWDAASGVRVSELRQDAEIGVAGFSPDGLRVVTGSADLEVRVWDASRTARNLVADLAGGVVDEHGVSVDGSRLLTFRDRDVDLWEASTGRRIAALAHDSRVEYAFFSDDGTRVITAAGRSLHVWDAATGRPTGELTRQEPFDILGDGRDGGAARTALRAGISADARRAITTEGAVTRVWDTATGTQVGELRADDQGGHATPVGARGFSPDGTRVLTAQGRSVQIWDAATRTRLRALTHDDAVASVTFSPDGTRVITAGEVSARLWDVATGGDLGSLNVEGDDVVAARFSPDSLRVVTRSGRSEAAPDGSRATTAGGPARLWDAVTGARVADLANAGPVKSAGFSPDGALVVTAGGTVRIWNAVTGAREGEITSGDPLDAARFSPDGRRVVTRAEYFSNRARIWDAQTGKPLAELTHDGGGRSAAVSAAGGADDAIWLASFTADGSGVITIASGIRVWRPLWPFLARSTRLVGEVCREALRGDARRLTESDVRVSRILTSRRIGEDVCADVSSAGAR